MNKFLLSFAILFSFGTLLSQSIEKNWSFQEIVSSQGESLFEIDPENDTFQLDKGVFSYSLKSKNDLEASGDYIFQNNLLVLFYNQPIDTIRRYRVTKLTETSLQFTENELVYSFAAAATIPITAESEINTDDSQSNLALNTDLGIGINTKSIGRGLLGMFFLITVCFLLSSNRRKINWRLVLTGIALQLIFAVLVLKVDFVTYGFDWISRKVVEFLNIAEQGALFVFGKLVDPSASMGYIFAFKVLPTIVFFSAFTSLLYYLGILQVVVKGLAWVMSKTMRLSGAESLAAAANVFIGQTEAPLVVKPYLDKMTKSEMLCLMVGGMATIAGGVLAAFIAFLGGDSIAEQAVFAKHLLTASIMSAPAAIVIAKILYPETEEVNTNLDISKEKVGTNILDAISRGTTDGLKLAVNVGAMLLVFTALMGVANWILGDLLGDISGLNTLIETSSDGRYNMLSMEYILGNVFAPVAWIIGVPIQDITTVGQLLGEKTILNEFYAYSSLSTLKASGAITNYRSIVIATYALCGFANFASIGIQIGGIGVLAPSQRGTLAKFGIKALIGGTIAALLTATIAGMLIG
ncbi:NupC/NupG family nucleoside CNT transporter [Patiriisocius sp. Uisw_017]|jgi:CNT family concentrative nucleoside transporter|uniref:NupC/NupG family nucleoside CNT transporter n=1 Tax=Patiriisocius sp. Uisw_017 TaxID=3230968 RepID=UPI0039EB6C3C